MGNRTSTVRTDSSDAVVPAVDDSMAAIPCAGTPEPEVLFDSITEDESALEAEGGINSETVAVDSSNNVTNSTSNSSEETSAVHNQETDTTIPQGAPNGDTDEQGAGRRTRRTRTKPKLFIHMIQWEAKLLLIRLGPRTRMMMTTRAIRKGRGVVGGRTRRREDRNMFNNTMKIQKKRIL